jgi:IS5 family transposase
MLAAAAFNFKRMMNKWKSSFVHFFENLFYWFLLITNLFRKQKLAF